MNYIGSKHKLSSFLLESIIHTIDSDLKEMVFCDLFAGTSAVGKTIKAFGAKQIISNDKEYYAYVLSQNYIVNSFIWQDLEERVKYLNSLQGEEGKIFSHYCLGGESGRMYFSDENGKRIDAIRSKIGEWDSIGEISKQEYYFLLASLLESADKVANTASVYGAFLKHYKASAQKPLIFTPASFQIGSNLNQAHCRDANQLIREIEGDILYLDPPYNTREYGANYHLLNTIALYDDFIPQGKTGLRAYEKSKYCKKGEALGALEDLINHAKFRYIFLSYNNEGILSDGEIWDIFSRFGRCSLIEREYSRFKSDGKRQTKSNSVIERLYVLEK